MKEFIKVSKNETMSLFNQKEINSNEAIKIISEQRNKQVYTKEEILNSVILGDSLKVLKKIPKETFDMVFIDPPYFLQLPKKELKRWKAKTTVEGVDDDWDKFSSFDEYDKFIQNLLIEIKRVMKTNATIWIISTYHSIFRIGKIMQDLGYWILNDVVWVKTNPMPNWLGVRFTNATETLIWAVKDKNSKKYTFNKDYAKQFGIGKIGANVWVLPLCSGKERLRDDKKQKIHSTQKPIELLKRVIFTSTNEGDLILDPVAGVGTTGYVSKILKRNFVMIEKNPKYVEWIKKRFRSSLVITDKPKVSKIKINQYFNLGDKI